MVTFVFPDVFAGSFPQWLVKTQGQRTLGSISSNVAKRSLKMGDNELIEAMRRKIVVSPMMDVKKRNQWERIIDRTADRLDFQGLSRHERRMFRKLSRNKNFKISFEPNSVVDSAEIAASNRVRITMGGVHRRGELDQYGNLMPSTVSRYDVGIHEMWHRFDNLSSNRSRLNYNSDSAAMLVQEVRANTAMTGNMRGGILRTIESGYWDRGVDAGTDLVLEGLEYSGASTPSAIYMYLIKAMQ